MPEHWISTDEAEDVAGSIRHALRMAQFVDSDPQAWKWIALALHSALQGACVCHLVTSAQPVGAVTERNAAEWLTYFDQNRIDPSAQPPRTHLMSLPELLQAVRKPSSAGDGSCPIGIEINDANLEWLRRFHQQIRNQFVHFAPMGWSIEVSGVPALGVLIARIISDISDARYAFRHQSAAEQQAMRRDLENLAAGECWRPKDS